MATIKELIESKRSKQEIIQTLSEMFPTFRSRGDWKWSMETYSDNPNDKFVYGTSPTEPDWVAFGWNAYDSELIAMYGGGDPKDFNIRETQRFDAWDELVAFLKTKNLKPDQKVLRKLEKEVKKEMNK